VAGITVTERNWLRAALLVFGATSLFWAIGAAEQRWRPAPRLERLVYDPVETSMRVVAIPHFLIAILFLATSRGMRRPRAWIWLAAMLALGAALCWLFALSGPASRLPQVLFLLYFAVHEFRDEAYFYVANGDAPKGTDPKRLRFDVLVAPVLLFWFAVAALLFAAAFEIGDLDRYTKLFYPGLPPAVRWPLGALPAAALAVALVRLKKRHDRTYPGGAWGFVRTHRPIFVVFGGIFLVILLELVAHQKVRAFVTLHVTAWYVFAMHQYARRPGPDPAPRRLSWTWMRATPAGFTFLHAGLALVVLALCVVFAYGFRNSPAQPGLWLLVSRDAFAYWTILHITISFVPRP
jgi:hypothetical protein